MNFDYINFHDKFLHTPDFPINPFVYRLPKLDTEVIGDQYKASTRKNRMVYTVLSDYCYANSGVEIELFPHGKCRVSLYNVDTEARYRLNEEYSMEEALKVADTLRSDHYGLTFLGIPTVSPFVIGERVSLLNHSIGSEYEIDYGTVTDTMSFDRVEVQFDGKFGKRYLPCEYLISLEPTTYDMFHKEGIDYSTLSHDSRKKPRSYFKRPIEIGCSAPLIAQYLMYPESQNTDNDTMIFGYTDFGTIAIQMTGTEWIANFPHVAYPVGSMARVSWFASRGDGLRDGEVVSYKGSQVLICGLNKELEETSAYIEANSLIKQEISDKSGLPYRFCEAKNIETGECDYYALHMHVGNTFDERVTLKLLSYVDAQAEADELGKEIIYIRPDGHYTTP